MEQSAIVCKLTGAEVQKGKATIIATLQKQVLEKKELTNGKSFKFNGTDLVFDQLANFIKTESQCCEFLTFTTKVSDEKSFIWLDITGQNGTKDFIEKELGF